MNEKKKEWVAR